jgi:hypothetical protein
MAAAATDVSTVTFAAGAPITVVGDADPDDDDVDTADDAATLVAPAAPTTTALLPLTVTAADVVAVAADGAAAPALALEASVAPSMSDSSPRDFTGPVAEFFSRLFFCPVITASGHP